MFCFVCSKIVDFSNMLENRQNCSYLTNCIQILIQFRLKYLEQFHFYTRIRKIATEDILQSSCVFMLHFQLEIVTLNTNIHTLLCFKRPHCTMKIVLDNHYESNIMVLIVFHMNVLVFIINTEISVDNIIFGPHNPFKGITYILH